MAPGAVFAVARAVVCPWWDRALEREEERIWPARLHRLAGSDAGPQFWWWRVVAREPATFPEVVTPAEALLGPAVAKPVCGGGSSVPRYERCCGASVQCVSPGGLGRDVVRNQRN